MSEHGLGVQLWWHAFGCVIPEGQPLAGSHRLTVFGGTTAAPRIAAGLDIEAGTYLASWDHEPSEEEKDEVIPPEYREEPECQ